MSRFIAYIFIFFAATTLILTGQVPARADPATMSAPQAYELTKKNELLLVDIRSRQEWHESGVAETAYPISMHEAGFLEKLAELQQSNPGKPVGIICATGGRTEWLQRELDRRGITNIIDISEGMFGNGSEPGWLKRGLPTRKFDG